MVLDPIPQSLPIHFFGSRPQPPTSPNVVLEFVACLFSSLRWDVSHNTHDSLSSWHDHWVRDMEMTPPTLMTDDFLMSPTTLITRWVRDVTIEFVTLWCLLQYLCLFEFATWSLSSLHWDVSHITRDSLSSWHDYWVRYIVMSSTILMSFWVCGMISQLVTLRCLPQHSWLVEFVTCSLRWLLQHWRLKTLWVCGMLSQFVTFRWFALAVMSHGTHVNASCRTYDEVMSHSYVTCMNESCRTCGKQNVMVHVWTLNFCCRSHTRFYIHFTLHAQNYF